MSPDFQERIAASYPGYLEQFNESAPAPRSTSRRSRCSPISPPNGRRRLQKMVANEVPVGEGLDQLAESVNRQLRQAGL